MRPQFSRRHPAPSAAEIDALRKAAGLSMWSMARLLEVSSASVEAWCYGRNTIPAPVYKLARILFGPRIARLRSAKIDQNRSQGLRISHGGPDLESPVIDP